MNLAGQIALTAARLVQHRTGAYADSALRLAQWGAERAADRIESAGPRIATLTDAGLKLTEITCRCVDQLVRQGLESAQGALTDGAERLRMTAKARDLGTLYAAQRAALPATRRRVVRDLETTWHIVTAASRDLFALARSTQGALSEPARRARPSSARKPKSRRPRPARGTKRATRRSTGEHHSTSR